jgi:hypothetical protein
VIFIPKILVDKKKGVCALFTFEGQKCLGTFISLVEAACSHYLKHLLYLSDRYLKMDISFLLESDNAVKAPTKLCSVVINKSV